MALLALPQPARGRPILDLSEPAGSPPWTPTGDPAGVPGSPSWPRWSLPVPAGPRHSGDLPPRAARRAPLPGLHHQPARPDPAILEACHRPHADVEDRIRGAKATGLRNLPFWALPPTTAG
jgi:hypothetical protein